MSHYKLPRVLLLTHLYPDDIDPNAGVWLQTLVEACKKLGVNIHVIHSNHFPGEDTSLYARPVHLIKEGVTGKFHRKALSTNVSTPSYWGVSLLPQFAEQLPRVLAISNEIRRLSKEGFKPDIIHAIGSYHGGVMGSLLSKWCEIPLVVTEVSSPYSLETKPSHRKLLARRTIKQATSILCISHGMKADVLKEHPNCERKCHVLHLPISQVFYETTLRQPNARNSKPLKLITTASMREQKGLLYLLDALAEVRERGYAIHWTHIGGGHLKDELVTHAKKLKLTNVTFLGALSNQDIAQELALADAFILPSIHETQAVVLGEAMASGLPSVYTACGAPETYMTDKEGIEVKAQSSLSLANGIITMLEQNHIFNREEIRLRAHELFNAESLAKQLLQHYRKALH